MAEDGATVIAASDSSGGVYNPKGLVPDDLMRHKEQSGSVIGYPGADSVTNEELLELKCTVLIPAAIENMLTEANADRVKAEIVAEGANGPTTPAADVILRERGIHQLPDILANAGGVTVSYFEWLQGHDRYFWALDEVNHKLWKIMAAAFDAVWDLAEKENVHMRMASNMIAVKRVADSMLLRGLYP
jgi:glutamate dehydrogenase (NAD(P)+)